MSIKRFGIALLAACITLLSGVGALNLSAEESNTEVWSIYSLKEDANGFPYFDTAPSHAYTDEGLRVTPHKGMESYTVQTDHAYFMDNGIYLEVKLDKPVKAGFLVFHLWDQNGFIMSNYHCGSGWECMIQLGEGDVRYLVSANLEEAKDSSNKNPASVLGSMKLKASVGADGSETYFLCLKDGTLFLNGGYLVGSTEAQEFLRELRPDGSVYVGVTLVMNDLSGAVPLTVTKFGRSPETAFVPGSEGDLPETGEASPETIPPEPSVTEPPTVETDDEPDSDETLPGGPSQGGNEETRPSQGGNTEETKPSDDEDEATERETVNDDDFASPFEETEPETEKEIKNESIRNLVEKLEGLDFSGCGAVVSGSGLGMMAMLAAAYVLTRKKH
jgi:hypothetical protein